VVVVDIVLFEGVLIAKVIGNQDAKYLTSGISSSSSSSSGSSSSRRHDLDRGGSHSKVIEDQVLHYAKYLTNSRVVVVVVVVDIINM